MKDCPIPEGYDAGRIRQSLEGAFKEIGYSGPVSITAYGDQTQTPQSTNYLMYRDMVEWRGQNPPPASMMIISNQVVDKFSWDLVRLQQQTLYNLFLAYSVRPEVVIVLSTIEEWGWEELLQNNPSAPLVVDGGKFYCKSCNFDSQSYKRFRKHPSLPPGRENLQ
ncbi:zinc finger protein-related [Raphanus sativus]|nr:zinc finger protein-related [Raphanus sativus]